MTCWWSCEILVRHVGLGQKGYACGCVGVCGYVGVCMCVLTATACLKTKESLPASVSERYSEYEGTSLFS